MAGVLIVGASHAGVETAVALRERGYAGEITLVGGEIHPPYQRPPLSKAYLAGSTTESSLQLRAPQLYRSLEIGLVLGERVVDLDPAVGIATTSGGRRLRFGRLALTVGARVRRLDVPGAGLAGIRYLRDRDDADAFGAALAAADPVVVVGGGFIGLEAAAVARSRGKQVTVVEAAPRLLGRAVAPVVSEFFRQAHQRRGVEVRCGRGVAGFEGRDGRVSGVLLDDGERLPAGLVLVGIGVQPRTELAAALGLDVDGGIIVDSSARTAHPEVVAAGDCTVFPDPMAGAGMVRLESVQNAVDQARVAAATLCGDTVDYRAVPRFWSDQYDLKLQIAGLSTGYDGIVVRGDPESEKFSALYYRQGRLVAIDAVNRPGEWAVVRKALATGGDVPAARAGDTSCPLKELVVVRG